MCSVLCGRAEMVRSVTALYYQSTFCLQPVGDGVSRAAIVDAVEAAGVDPCDAAPDHWRHIHNRIAAGHQPRLYTVERHSAWLKRREIEG